MVIKYKLDILYQWIILLLRSSSGPRSLYQNSFNTCSSSGFDS